MIGAIVYRLRAVNTARIPEAHGKLLHGLLFRQLQQFSPELSAFVHDELNIKPFTTAYLRWIGRTPKKDDGTYFVEPDTVCLWRVTALYDILLPPLLEWKVGSELRIGAALFVLEKVMADSKESEEAGLLDENELIAACLAVQSVRNITFRFLSPVSFRYFSADMPLPRPEFIFGSLADKWNQAEMPFPLSKEEIKILASQCKLIQWEGRSCKTYFTPKQGVNGFIGMFRFDLCELKPFDRRLLLLLAQFSTFSGVGRLTGQGLGQTRITYI